MLLLVFIERNYPVDVSICGIDLLQSVSNLLRKWQFNINDSIGNGLGESEPLDCERSDSDRSKSRPAGGLNCREMTIRRWETKRNGLHARKRQFRSKGIRRG